MKSWVSDTYGIEFRSGKRCFYITNADLAEETLTQWLKLFSKMGLSKEQIEEFKEVYQERKDYGEAG